MAAARCAVESLTRSARSDHAVPGRHCAHAAARSVSRYKKLPPRQPMPFARHCAAVCRRNSSGCQLRVRDGHRRSGRAGDRRRDGRRCAGRGRSRRRRRSAPAITAASSANSIFACTTCWPPSLSGNEYPPRPTAHRVLAAQRPFPSPQSREAAIWRSPARALPCTVFAGFLKYVGVGGHELGHADADQFLARRDEELRAGRPAPPVFAERSGRLSLARLYPHGEVQSKSHVRQRQRTERDRHQLLRPGDCGSSDRPSRA